MSYDPLPPALLSRLRQDSLDLSSSLASSPLPDATSSGRTYADRRLLALAPRALDTLEDLTSSNHDDKIRLGAATEILRRSPATRDSLDLLSSGQSLPASMLAVLATTLSSFASAFSKPSDPTATSSLSPAPDQETVSFEPIESEPTPASTPARPEDENDSTFSLEELSMHSDPLPLSDLPNPTSSQMTAHGLVSTEPEPEPVQPATSSSIPKRKPGRPRKNSSKE